MFRLWTRSIAFQTARTEAHTSTLNCIADHDTCKPELNETKTPHANIPEKYDKRIRCSLIKISASLIVQRAMHTADRIFSLSRFLSGFVLVIIYFLYSLLISLYTHTAVVERLQCEYGSSGAHKKYEFRTGCWFCTFVNIGTSILITIIESCET